MRREKQPAVADELGLLKNIIVMKALVKHEKK
jgi:hypothetical protein